MLDKLIPEKVKQLEEYKPNTEICAIRLDANESPFLPSEAVLSEMAEAIRTIDFNRYPDPYASELIEEFAKIYHLDPQNVVAGNGSDELISLICGGLIEQGDHVTVVVPDFSMYEFYSNLAGASSTKIIKSDDFSLNYVNLVQTEADDSSKIVIFSNPCNPTGQMCDRETIVKIIRSTNAIVVIDEAYMEFAPQNQSVIDLTAECENLIVLKTMSKAFGAAALRLGFAVTNPALASTIRKIKSPYNVNTVSQVLGKIILSHYSEVEAHIAELKDNAQYLKAKLEKIESKKIRRICQTSANFVYLQLTSQSLASEIKTKLMERGIAIRCMSSGGYLRITAGNRKEIETFIEAFKEVLSC